MTRSRQPRPQPQATGTAASTARNGTAMNSAMATRSLADWRMPLSVPELADSGAGSGCQGLSAVLAAVAEAVVGAVIGESDPSPVRTSGDGIPKTPTIP